MTAQQRYLESCGSFRNAVHAVMSLSRAGWTICAEARSSVTARDVVRAVRIGDVQQVFNAALERPALQPTFEPLIGLLLELKLAWQGSDDRELVLRPSIVNPLELVRTALGGVRPDHELRYFTMQNIRHYYRCVQSSHVAHDLHALANAVNGLISIDPTLQTRSMKTVLHVSDDLLRCLSAVLTRHPAMPNSICTLFLECCRVLNYLFLSAKVGHVEIRTAFVDAEYMLSRLFGLPTAIPGLDDLFGGGGLMLVEAAPDRESECIGGRAVLTVGPFGTGKSLLSLQVAVEVARKGGVAWVMPLEQTTEECLYALQSTGGLPDDSPLRVATTVPDALTLLEQPDGERGALILLRSIKESFSDFVSAFDEHVRLMQNYPLRLIVVDPVSALSQAEAPDIAARRMALLQLFESVKRQGTNIWLVAEDELPGEGTRYEQNIADTVIKVSTQVRHGYSQRYIEITKSRLQREQRGLHAFAIGPGRGITVIPSPAAVRSRIKTRTIRAPGHPIKSGLPSLDAILGETGLHAGDVMVLQGPSGCSKTEVGVSFLLEEDWHGGGKGRVEPRQRSLLVSARENEATLNHVLGRVRTLRRRREAHGKQTRPADVRIVVIEGGYVKPGFILQRIEDQFHEAQLAGFGIGRVMVDSIPHWDLSCPYVHEDNTFGDTLIDLLRRHRVTTLITCGQRGPQAESVLYRSVLDSADCLIQFESVEFKGTSHVMVRVSHTRDMKHRREYFELQSDANMLELKTASTLLRVEPGGRLSPVKVILFLHAESPAHDAYNRTLLTLVRSVLSRDAEIQHDSPANVLGALGLATSSAIDELQVVQLEEFQVPPARARGDGTWRVFERSWAAPRREDMLPRLRERVERGSGLLAVPFFVNVGLLAHHRSVDAHHLESWQSLARASAAWEAEWPDAIFFDCPRDDESYNCLFFEILHSFAGPPPGDTGSHPNGCALESWLRSDAAVEAMVIFHRLCSRAHRKGSGDTQLREKGTASVSSGARVWRHWYTTLSAMMGAMTPEDRANIVVRALPDGMSVAGDCFLAIPEYSTASDVGRNLIQLLTRQEAELDRVRLGVGLPTRASFYPSDGLPVSVSPYFTIDAATLNTAVAGTLRRSAFGCYQAASGLLASHLRSVIASRASLEAELRDDIRSGVQQLTQRLGFIGQGSCHRCGASGRQPNSS